ncbi:MAG: hypothetical protein ACKKMS_02510 [Candidatus Nealsonbacteria bacterium]
MLIFYTQVSNPDSEKKKRFLRMKQAIAREFKRMKKFDEKMVSLGHKKPEKLIMKCGQNFLAIHQFRSA